MSTEQRKSLPFEEAQMELKQLCYGLSGHFTQHSYLSQHIRTLLAFWKVWFHALTHKHQKNTTMTCPCQWRKKWDTYAFFFHLLSYANESRARCPNPFQTCLGLHTKVCGAHGLNIKMNIVLTLIVQVCMVWRPTVHRSLHIFGR